MPEIFESKTALAAIQNNTARKFDVSEQFSYEEKFESKTEFISRQDDTIWSMVKHGNEVLLGTNKCKLIRWDPSSGKTISSYFLGTTENSIYHRGEGLSALVLLDEDLLACGFWHYDVPFIPIQIFNLKTYKEVRSLDEQTTGVWALTKHKNTLISSDTLGNKDGFLSPNTGILQVIDFETNKKAFFPAHKTCISALNVFSDGRLLTSDILGDIKIWDIETRKCLIKFKTPPRIPRNDISKPSKTEQMVLEMNTVRGVAIISSEAFITTNEDGTLRSWNIKTKKNKILIDLYEITKQHTNKNEKSTDNYSTSTPLMLLNDGRALVGYKDHLIIINIGLKNLKLSDIMQHLMALQTNTSVEVVNLQHVQLTDADVEDFLVPLFLVNRTIKQIDLRFTKITEKGIQNLRDKIKNREPKLEMLHESLQPVATTTPVLAVPEAKRTVQSTPILETLPQTLATPTSETRQIVKINPEETKKPTGLISYARSVGNWFWERITAAPIDHTTAAQLKTLPDRIAQVESKTKLLTPQILQLLTENAELFERVLEKELEAKEVDDKHKEIIDDEKLAAYYTMFFVLLNGAINACRGTFSTYGENGKKYTSEQVGNALKEVAQSIPIFGLGAKILAAVIQGRNFKGKNVEIQNLAFLFAGDKENTEQLVKELAREVTLLQKEKIKKLSTTLTKGVLAKVKNRYNAIKDWCLADGSSDPIKELARQDFELIAVAAHDGKLTQPISTKVLRDVVCPEAKDADPVLADKSQESKKEIILHEHARSPIAVTATLVQFTAQKSEVKAEVAPSPVEVNNAGSNTSDLSGEIAELKEELRKLKSKLAESEPPGISSAGDQLQIVVHRSTNPSFFNAVNSAVLDERLKDQDKVLLQLQEELEQTKDLINAQLEQINRLKQNQTGCRLM